MNDEAKRMIGEVQALIGRLLNAGHDVTDLNNEAKELLGRLEQQQDVFAAAYGPDVANPTTRAWYLLKTCTEHATLLRQI